MTHNSRSKAFTLIELLVVIAIIGLLAGIVMTGVNAARKKAKISAAKAEMQQILNALAMLESDTAQWPGNKTPEQKECTGLPSANNEICPDGCDFKLSDCQAGLVCQDGSYSGWNGPYIDEFPKDPWGNEYFMDTDYFPLDQGCVVAIGSYGPNGTRRNGYDSDDIILILPAQ